MFFFLVYHGLTEEIYYFCGKKERFRSLSYAKEFEECYQNLQTLLE